MVFCVFCYYFELLALGVVFRGFGGFCVGFDLHWWFSVWPDYGGAYEIGWL